MNTLNTGNLLSTEDFPYTAGYVLELLSLSEGQLMNFTRALGLTQKRDERTGKLVFHHRDVELLKRAVEMTQAGEDLHDVAQRLSGSALNTPQPEFLQRPVQQHSPSTNSANLPYLSSPSSLSGRDNLAVMVETVSQVKEGILKDLSRLLDDKLSGLDEVVVELIRCKSENDSLKKRLEEAQRGRESLERELASFRPVQFGFYKKTNY